MNLILVLRDAAAWLACVVLLIAVVGGPSRGSRALRCRAYGWAVSLAVGGVLVAAWVR